MSQQDGRRLDIGRPHSDTVSCIIHVNSAVALSVSWDKTINIWLVGFLLGTGREESSTDDSRIDQVSSNEIISSPRRIVAIPTKEGYLEKKRDSGIPRKKKHYFVLNKVSFRYLY